MLKQLLGITTSIIVVAFEISAASVSGTVVDDTGAVVPGTIMEIHNVRNLTHDGSGHLVSAGPAFSAAPQLSVEGAFSVSNVPAGSYYICAYPTIAGYLSNCEWRANSQAVSVAAQAVLTLPLTLIRGTVVQIAVTDTKGLVGPPASLTAPYRGVHHFFPGVMNANGYYSAARQAQYAEGQHLYTVTIPKQEVVYLFIDSDLYVTTAAGQNVRTRTRSSIKISGGQPTTAINLAVQ